MTQVLPLPTDFYDYIFQFPSYGAYIFDPTLRPYTPLAFGGPPGYQLLVYNPVTKDSVDALPGFWAMLTLPGPIVPALQNHPNLQILNDRTLLLLNEPSVVVANIDVTDINIVINIYGIYIRDGMAFAVPANGYVTEDGLIFYAAEDATTFYVQET